MIRIGDAGRDGHRPAPLHALLHAARGPARTRVARHRHPRRRRVRDRSSPRSSCAASSSTNRAASSVDGRQRRSRASSVDGDGLYRATFEPLPTDHGHHDRRRSSSGRSSTRSPSIRRRCPIVAPTTGSPVTLAVAALGVHRRLRACTCGRAGAAATRCSPVAPPTPPSAMLPPPDPDGSTRAARCRRRSSPTTGSTSWPRSSSCRPRASPRGRRRRCSTSSSTTAPSRRGCPDSPAARRSSSTEVDDKLAIGSGRGRGELDGADAALLDGLHRRAATRTSPATYDPEFAAAWSRWRRCSRQRIASSGWWKHLPPGGGLGGSGSRARRRSA